MGNTGHDLLTEPVFLIRRGAEDESEASLTEALASMAEGADVAFLALQPHQRHAWHAFLVQLAALALHRADLDELPVDPVAWKQLLVALVDEEPEAFCLVVDDLSKPAFFQPPVPEGTLEKFRAVGTCADDLDMLVTAGNHYLKQSRMRTPRPEHFAYALCNLQTMEGFSGRQNYGVARMNGGLSNRPCLGYVPQEGDGLPFLADLASLRGSRSALLERYDYAAKDGHGLLWLRPWGGQKSESLTLSDLDPWFVEVCRRVRLVGLVDGPVTAVARSTPAPRIQPGERKGNTGDYWTPVKRADGAALTIPADGFTYRKLQQILFGDDYLRNPALNFGPLLGSSPVLVARAFVRGQGKTEGYHERRIPIGRAASRLMASTEGHEQLAVRAAEFVKRAATVSKKVLSVAVCTLLQPDRDKLDFRDHRKDRFVSAFEDAVDAIFFKELFGSAKTDSESANLAFDRQLLSIVKRIYQDAVESIPLPSARRYKAVARADDRFWGLLRKHLRDALDDVRAQGKETQHAEN